MGEIASFAKEGCCKISVCGDKEVSETKYKSNISKSITKHSVVTDEYHSINSNESTERSDELDEGKHTEMNVFEEENQKLKDIINQMTQQIDDQKLENNALETQLNEYQQPSEVQNTNESLAEIEENKELDIDYGHLLKKVRTHEKLVTDDRVMDTLEKTKTGLPIRQIIMSQYKSDQHISIGDMADIESDNEPTDVETDSSYEEQEILEIEKRKTEKSLDDEAIAMQKEIQEMQIMSEKSLKKYKITITSPSPNLFRTESSNKWDATELAQQKKEMQEHMIHMISSHTKSCKVDSTETPENEDNS